MQQWDVTHPRKEWSTDHAAKWMRLDYAQEEASHHGPNVYNSIYVKCLEQVGVLPDKGQERGGEEELVPFEGGEHVLKLIMLMTVRLYEWTKSC